MTTPEKQAIDLEPPHKDCGGVKQVCKRSLRYFYSFIVAHHP